MRDELLALLEERPYHLKELAQLLERPRDLVRHELRQLFQAGQVKRYEDLWCLPSFVGPRTARQQPAPIRQEDQVFEAVRAGYGHAHAIAGVTGLAVKTVSAYLSILHAAKKIEHLQTVQGSGPRPMRVYGLPRVQTPSVEPEPATKACRRCGRPMPTGGKGMCARCTGRGFVPGPERPIDEVASIEFRDASIGAERVCPGPDCGKRFPADRAVAGEFCSTRCAETPRPLTTTRIINGVEYEAISVGAHSISSWKDVETKVDPRAPTLRVSEW